MLNLRSVTWTQLADPKIFPHFLAKSNLCQGNLTFFVRKEENLQVTSGVPKCMTLQTKVPSVHSHTKKKCAQSLFFLPRFTFCVFPLFCLMFDASHFMFHVSRFTFTLQLVRENVTRLGGGDLRWEPGDVRVTHIRNPGECDLRPLVCEFCPPQSKRACALESGHHALLKSTKGMYPEYEDALRGFHIW